MTDAFSTAIALLDRWGGPHTILHLGAGLGNTVEAYRSSRAKRIVLVEPQPDLARRLAALAAEDPRIALCEAAVAATSGRATLQVFNLVTLSSLRSPRALMQFFPGLRQTATSDVETVAFPTLMDDLPAAKGDPADLLVIDTPGEEATVVDALIARPDRHRFGAIVLWGGTGEDYEGSTPVEELARRIEAAGYRLQARDDSDPDRPGLVMCLDRLAIENDALRASREALEMTAAAQGTRIAALQEQLAGLETDNFILTAQVEGQQAEILSQHDLVEELTRARDAQARAINVLTQDRDFALERVKSVERQLNDLQFKVGVAREEFHRSEGQIALIKDLLLREGGL